MSYFDTSRQKNFGVLPMCAVNIINAGHFDT